MNPKVEDPYIGAGVSIKRWAKDRLIVAAKKEGVTASRYMGMVLMDWAKELPMEVDPRQERLELVENERVEE